MSRKPHKWTAGAYPHEAFIAKSEGKFVLSVKDPRHTGFYLRHCRGLTREDIEAVRQACERMLADLDAAASDGSK